MDPLTNLAKLFMLDYAGSEVCQLLVKFGFKVKVQPEHYLIPSLHPYPQGILLTNRTSASSN